MSGMAASAMDGTFAGVSGIILLDVRSIGGHLADSPIQRCGSRMRQCFLYGISR